MRSAIALMVLLLCSSACGNAAPTPAANGGGPAGDETYVLTAADAGLDLEVAVGDTIEVTLEGNPSTGYGWEVESVDAAVLEMVGEPEFVSAAAADLVGAAGTFTFTFTAAAGGKTDLVLVYRRPWEADATPADGFGATITVVG